MSGQQERKRVDTFAAHDDANLVTIIALPLRA